MNETVASGLSAIGIGLVFAVAGILLSRVPTFKVSGPRLERLHQEDVSPFQWRLTRSSWVILAVIGTTSALVGAIVTVIGLVS